MSIEKHIHFEFIIRENETYVDLRMVSSSAKTNQVGGFFSVARTCPIRWIMAIVLEQCPVSVLSTPSDTVGMLSSVIGSNSVISFIIIPEKQCNLPEMSL